MLKENLTKQLRRDEGVEKNVYRDSLGYLTIGIGRLVDPGKPGGGLRDSEMDFMLANDIEDRISTLTKRLAWFPNLDEARQGVLVNMSFQLGVEGLLGFKNTLKMVQTGDYTAAAIGMLRSLWAKQTPERAERMAEQMKTGVWQ